MSRKITWLAVLAAWLVTGCQPQRSRVPESTLPVKIIFDTDMGPDFDDAGAIAVLHALAARGECEILATLASDRHPTIAPTIEAFNRYFGKPDIPVGVPVDDGPDFTCPNHWNDSILVKFLKEPKTNADYPSAVRVYRQVLAAQPDQSVTIVTVGFMTNLEDLLKSGADEFSELRGTDLVKKKVRNYVTMAGSFPEGWEFNVKEHAAAAQYVFENWPTPILFSGFEIGEKIMTGRRVADEGSSDNPVAWAYRYCLETYHGGPLNKRCSWDHTAVLTAVRNPRDYFYVVGDGKFVVMPDGKNYWDASVNAGHSFLVHKMPYDSIATVLDELMMYEP